MQLVKFCLFSGFGYADVENQVVCSPDTVMKIASISKPITVTMLMKLSDMGAIDIDQNIKHYIKYWPEKMYNGKKVRVDTYVDDDLLLNTELYSDNSKVKTKQYTI